MAVLGDVLRHQFWSPYVSLKEGKVMLEMLILVYLFLFQENVEALHLFHVDGLLIGLAMIGTPVKFSAVDMHDDYEM